LVLSLRFTATVLAIALTFKKRIVLMLGMNKKERLARSSDLLRTFVAVADCGNITHAADTLGRTQSAISVQTRKLEDTLEVRLFDRQARGMVLTTDGEKLLPVARNIMSDLGRVAALFENPLQGRLRVGIPDDYAETVLEHVLVEFARRHPLVEISACFGCTSEFPDAVRRGKLDIAVVSDADVLSTNRIAAEPNVWAAAHDFSCDLHDPVPLAILDRNACRWRRFGTDALDADGRSWRMAYASESFAGVKAAIRSGLAIGVLPRSLLEPSMKELSDADGFPTLPKTERGILKSDKAPQDISQAMVDAIRSATVSGRTRRSDIRQ